MFTIFRPISKIFLLGMFFTLCIIHTVQASSPQTALDDYVNTPDPSYNFTFAAPPIDADGYKLYVIYMSSQQWRTSAEVDRTQWTHWMVMVVPDTVVSDTGMLFVASGENTGPPELDATEVLVGIELARSSSTIVTVLGQIPNQPLFFQDEPFSHKEDALVAYSFDKGMNSGDWTWPAYVPMTKAAVRAMDTVQAVTADAAVVAVPVRQFVVTGFSKRGAITWLTGVVDPRVRAIAPGVFDVLDIDDQVEHHFAAYGFYSGALQDYVNYNILRRLRTPEGQDLLRVVDPISYKDRLTMPKFLLVSSGDSFFHSESSRFYFDRLEGETLIRYVANSDHSLESTPGDLTDAAASLISWYLSVIYEVPRPNVSWQHKDGQLIVETDQPVLQARFWQAHNPNARDFRLETIGRVWQPQLLAPSAPGVYAAPVPVSNEGWTAYYIDLVFAGPGGLPQTYSTSIFVTPDSLPFEVSDPLLEPHSAAYWKRQIRGALAGGKYEQIPAEVLAGYLPIPLFDQYVTTLQEAADVFADDSRDKVVRARKQCLALRLNVRDGQLGWYTGIRVDDDDDDDDYEKTYKKRDTQKLWQLYSRAHDSFLHGRADIARDICSSVNRL